MVTSWLLGTSRPCGRSARPSGLAPRPWLALLLRGRGVLQLVPDEEVRDGVAIAQVKPPARREVLVQPPVPDPERHAEQHLVDDEVQPAVRDRHARAGVE